jgi:hypothetical protein
LCAAVVLLLESRGLLFIDLGLHQLDFVAEKRQWIVFFLSVQNRHFIFSWCEGENFVGMKVDQVIIFFDTFVFVIINE